VVDNGASRHFSANESDFTDLRATPSDHHVSGIDCKIKGVGSIVISVLDNNGRCVKINLENVLYVPGLATKSNGHYQRLMSVNLATQKGCRFSFAKHVDFLLTANGTVIRLARHNGLVWLSDYEASNNPKTPISPEQVAAAAVASVSSLSRDLIHRRCGHLHEEGLLKLDKLEIDGIWGFSLLPKATFCPDCAVAKSRVRDISKKSTRDKDPPHPFIPWLWTYGDLCPPQILEETDGF
jgi:hypothetical protein